MANEKKFANNDDEVGFCPTCYNIVAKSKFISGKNQEGVFCPVCTTFSKKGILNTIQKGKRLQFVAGILE